jgi:hypothetical protein
MPGDSSRRRRRIEARLAQAVRDSQASLELYLSHVVVDARPEPVAWSRICEPWQQSLVGMLAPAIERLAGLPQGHAHGNPRREFPRSCFVVLPRGHDKTGLVGRVMNWLLAFSRIRLSAVAAAADLDQARLIIQSMAVEAELNPWLKSRLRVSGDTVRGPGGRFQVISSDASSSSGLKCDLILCDELTFWPRRDLFDVLWSGREKRPDSLFVVITNAGIRGSWQHELYALAKSTPDQWRVFEAPPRQQLAGWMSPERIAAMRSLLPESHARRVLDNEWVSATERPLLTYDLLAGCEADCLWQGQRPERSGELYIGVDVGRTRDRTVIWTFELVGDTAWTREIVVLENAPFAVQRAEIEARITPNVVSVRVDRGGLGFQLAEELESRFPKRCTGVAMSAGRQAQWALAFQSAFERRRIRIPHDPALIADFQLVDEAATGRDGLPLIQTRRGPGGHADRFWAAVLAHSGLPVEPRSGVLPPRGVLPKW